MTTLFDKSKWSTSPTAYWTIQYEDQRSGNDMQYRFHWKVELGFSSSYYNNGLQLQLFVNGTQNNVTVKTYDASVKGWSYEGTTGWYTVSNKTSGTVPFYAQLYDTNNYKVKATSTTYALTVSTAAATITSAPDFNDNSNPTIYYSNPAGTSVSNLYGAISVDGTTSIIDVRTLDRTGTAYTFTLTDSEREKLRNATNGKPSIPVYFAVISVISGTQYTRSVEKTFSLQETDTTKPSVELKIETDNSVIPTDAQSQFEGLYIQGVSKAKGNVSYTFKYGATLNNISVVFGSSNMRTSSFATDTISVKGEQTVTASVMDSRGFTGKDAKKITVLPYDTPTITACDGATAIVCDRWDDEKSELSTSGTRLKVKCKRSYSPISVDGVNKNLCSIQWRRAVEGASIDNEPWLPLLDGASDSDELDIVISDANFYVSKAYLVQLRAIDTVGKSHTIDFPIPTDLVPLHLGENGNCVGIGRYAVPPDPSKGEEGRFTIAEGWAIYHGDTKLNI